MKFFDRLTAKPINVKRIPVRQSHTGLRRYDALDPEEAILLAWTVAGGHPRYHAEQQQIVRERMPLLARALDRMAEEHGRR